MLSAQSKYALRALIYLSENKKDGYIRVTQIADETKLPGPYLSKLIKILTEKQILISKRGKNGGTKINPDRPPITFYDICEAIEDPLIKQECVLFKKPCDKNNPCPFHSDFSSTKEKLLSFLRNKELS